MRKRSTAIVASVPAVVATACGRSTPSLPDVPESITIFPRVPTGVPFSDGYGEEWPGRQLDFVESVTSP